MITSDNTLVHLSHHTPLIYVGHQRPASVHIGSFKTLKKQLVTLFAADFSNIITSVTLGWGDARKAQRVRNEK